MFKDEFTEKLVVGRLLSEPSILSHTEIPPRLFTDVRARATFQVIEEVAEKLVDTDLMHNIEHVADGLEKKHQLDQVGGLIGLSDYHPALGETFYERVEELKKYHVNREIYKSIAKAQEQLKRQEVGGIEVVDGLISTLNGLTESEAKPKTLKENVKDEIKWIFDFLDAEAKGEKPMVGIPTGIGVLDSVIGGIPIGVPTVFAARPGEGKSTLALNLAVNAAKQGLGVQIFTYEDGERSFSQRMISLRTEIDLANIVQVKLNEDARTKIRAMSGKWLDSVHIEKAHNMGVLQIGRSFRAMRRQLNTKIIIVDYLQLMPSVDSKAATHENLERNMKDLSVLAAQENIAVVVLSQLKREAQGAEPKLSDMARSGSIEQIGKLVVALHTDNPESTELKFIILKNFQGKRGWVIAHYDRATCSIR